MFLFIQFEEKSFLLKLKINKKWISIFTSNMKNIIATFIALLQLALRFAIWLSNLEISI